VPDVSKLNVEEKASWLQTEVHCFLEELLQPNEVAEKVDELDIAHREGFTCRNDGCAAVFPLHSSRVR
jgi:hypothetical protein